MAPFHSPLSRMVTTINRHSTRATLTLVFALLLFQPARAVFKFEIHNEMSTGEDVGRELFLRCNSTQLDLGHGFIAFEHKYEQMLPAPALGKAMPAEWGCTFECESRCQAFRVWSHEETRGLLHQCSECIWHVRPSGFELEDVPMHFIHVYDWEDC